MTSSRVFLSAVAVFTVVSGCAAKEPAAAQKSTSTHKFSIRPEGGDKPITLQMDVPAGWKEETLKSGDVSLTIPGLADQQVSLLALGSLSGNAGEMMTTAIKLQFGEDLKDAKRENLSGGRVWITRKERSYDHARVFVPYAGGVAMGLAMIEDAKGTALPQVKAAFSTLTVTP